MYAVSHAFVINLFLESFKIRFSLTRISGMYEDFDILELFHSLLSDHIVLSG